MIFTQ